MTIYLIRHGETVDNKRRVLQMPDSPLSETGIQQASQLAKRLAPEKITKILCSDYPRAQQTAERINKNHQLDIQFEPLLRERHFGDWRGKQYDEVAKDRLNSDLSPPNGEDTASFFERVSSTWEFIKQNVATDGGITVVVSHGLTCRAIVQNHLPLIDGLSLPERWSNTSLTVMEHFEDWVVTKVNCIAHL
jgi:broad specificity phosphatase PhoE